MKISNWRFVLLMALIIIVFNMVYAGMGEKTIWLDEIGAEYFEEGWGETNVNKSIGGNELTINGQEYKRGIGTHAEGSFRIELDGKAERFTAFVGIDDEIGVDNQYASVEFSVVSVKGKKKPKTKVLWQSNTLKAGQSAVKVDLDLKGQKEIRLIVTDGGNGINYDHADWCDAKIEYTGEKPEAIKPYIPKPYILTPKPGPEPKIVGAKVFGLQPGSPCLFKVPATGEKPIEYSAENLPAGLKINPDNGVITGKITKKGTYSVVLHAKNHYGEDQRDFRIVVGDTIALTPPMGWNSWNCWATSVTDEKIRQSAKAMVDKGLIDHGWTYINIDDCWMVKPDSDDPMLGGSARDENGYPLANKYFPDMKGLTDYIHDLGLKAGIYTSPGPTTCQDYEGSWQHEYEDAQQFAKWEFDYLKYDWCGYSKVSGHENLEDLQRPYILMRKMLDKVDRDIVYSICQYGWGEVWKWGEEVGGNCWRTTGDIVDSWGSMAGIGFKQAELSEYAKPGQWNDPDMLVVGNVGWGANLHPSRLTPDEQYTHISLWCLLSAPLLIGCPIEQLDDFTLNLLINDEVLAINQDPLGEQTKRIVNVDDYQIWFKKLEDGSMAVGLFNMNDFEVKKVKVKWSDLGINGSQTVRDLWRQKNLGKFKNSFTSKIPPHGVRLIRVFSN